MTALPGLVIPRPRGAFTWPFLRLLAVLICIFSLCLTALASGAKEKDSAQYGVALILNIPFPESEVTQVVQDVVQNGIIRGTREYEKDEYIQGATSATSSRLFPEWTEGGKVFYKVRLKALDPRNFKDANDVGTLAVRYIVQPQGEKNTVVRIDAVFAEDFRRVVHASNGSVESAEFKDIKDHLDAINEIKAQTAEAEREKLDREARKNAAANQSAVLVDESSSRPMSSSRQPDPHAPDSQLPVTREPDASLATAQPTPPPPVEVTASEAAAAVAPQTLEERAKDLRRQVERVVKAPGAPLKSAPFHTASVLQSLPAGTEVLIVISTPYWLGVETHDGQHGWIIRDSLELVP